MNVVIFPEPGYEGKCFEPAPNDWHKPMVELKRQLETQGATVREWDRSPEFPYGEKDIGIYFDNLAAPPPKGKSILVVLEPPVVAPRTYERLHGWPFTRILTFARDYCDDKRVFYSPYPIVKYTGLLSDVKRDGYICAITSGGKSFGPMYEARRLSYLSWGKDLDLYGWGWEKDPEVMNACNYKGAIEGHKVRVLARYKFAIVFENWHPGPGYCSEKYWDCIQAGTFPLYRGWRPDYTLDDACEEAWAKRIVEHVKSL